MPRLAIVALTAIILAGCTSPVTIRVAQIETHPPLNLEEPAPVTQGKIDWVIINDKNAAQVLASHGGVLVGLTVDGFKVNLSNQADVLRYVKQQRAVILAYRHYYEK